MRTLSARRAVDLLRTISPAGWRGALARRAASLSNQERARLRFLSNQVLAPLCLIAVAVIAYKFWA
jgi:hypothetical protein